MPDKIKIKCSAKDCDGFIYYEPSDPGIVMNLRTVLDAKVDTEITKEEFAKAVVKIIADPKIKVSTTETIYLTCTGDPSHSKPYEIPA